jgi:2-polyprenyl-6-methoxyphenol hydroxylase-like FAD-dependent oxidoreductase
MTFHRGQGGNLAIKDADEFVNSITAVKRGEKDIEDAVDAYDNGALLRSAEVEISRQASMAFLDYENFDKNPVFKMGISPAMKF